MPAADLPLVSVVLPAYNAEHTVVQALASLQAQTFTDFEVVVVNDGSTDGTARVVADLASTDGRIRLIDRAENRGLVASLIEGVAAARGPLIARLDADDTSRPTRLQRQVEQFADDGVVLSATAFTRILPDGTLLRESRPPVTHGGMAAALAVTNRLNHSAVMFRRSAYDAAGGYDPATFPAEDYDLWLRMMRVGEFRGVDEILVDCTSSPNGVSGTRAEEQRQMCEALRASYVRELTGRVDTFPGRPRRCRALQRVLAADLHRRGIEPGMLNEEVYRIAMAGTGSAWLRRLRLLSAPGLLRGRVR